MSTPPNAKTSIRARLADNAPDGPPRFLWGATGSVCLGHLRHGTSLTAGMAEMVGRSVLIAVRDQFAAALALIELDGIARRLILCTPDFPSEHVSAVAAAAGADAIVSDHDRGDDGSGISLRILCTGTVTPANDLPVACCNTEWVLFTSGTTGTPKMLVHSVASLTAPISTAMEQGADIVWGTFYDIRRYGGLQIFFRGCPRPWIVRARRRCRADGHASERLGAHGATHVSGTPSHWRRVLMSPHARAITPRYIRLSGEIADQGILERASLVLSRRPASAMRLPRPKPASDSKSTTVSKDFPRAWSARPATCTSKSRMVRCGSVPRRNALGYLGDEHGPLADRRRLRRHWRHGGTPRRSVLLPRPQERHHQCRRTEGPPGGSRSGDQPPPGGPHVNGAVDDEVPLPARSSPQISC